MSEHKRLKIATDGEKYWIEGRDSNGVWVDADPSAEPMKSKEEAEEALGLWESIPYPPQD